MPCCCANEEHEPHDSRSVKSSLQEEDSKRIEALRVLEVNRAPQPVPRALSQINFTPVHLNVYHLIDTKKNKKFEKIGFGLFHTGVEIHGMEWSYGEAVDATQETGLFVVSPMQAMPSSFYKRLYLGETTYSPEQVDTLLHRMECEWKSSKYHVLHKNCNHFAKYFCKKLSTVTPLIVPNCYNRIANLGDTLIPKKVATWAVRKFDDSPPPAVCAVAKGRVNHLPDSVIPKQWYRVYHIRREPQFVIPAPSTAHLINNRENDASRPAASGTKKPAMPDFNAARESAPKPNFRVTHTKFRNDGPQQPGRQKPELTATTLHLDPMGASATAHATPVVISEGSSSTHSASELPPGAIQSPAASATARRASQGRTNGNVEITRFNADFEEDHQKLLERGASSRKLVDLEGPSRKGNSPIQQQKRGQASSSMVADDARNLQSIDFDINDESFKKELEAAKKAVYLGGKASETQRSSNVGSAVGSQVHTPIPPPLGDFEAPRSGTVDGDDVRGTSEETGNVLADDFDEGPLDGYSPTSPKPMAAVGDVDNEDEEFSDPGSPQEELRALPFTPSSGDFNATGTSSGAQDPSSPSVFKVNSGSVNRPALPHHESSPQEAKQLVREKSTEEAVAEIKRLFQAPASQELTQSEVDTVPSDKNDAASPKAFVANDDEHNDTEAPSSTAAVATALALEDASPFEKSPSAVTPTTPSTIIFGDREAPKKSDENDDTEAKEDEPTASESACSSPRGLKTSKSSLYRKTAKRHSLPDLAGSSSVAHSRSASCAEEELLSTGKQADFDNLFMGASHEEDGVDTPASSTPSSPTVALNASENASQSSKYAPRKKKGRKTIFAPENETN